MNNVDSQSKLQNASLELISYVKRKFILLE